MATLMEKDALIEFVAGAKAVLLYRVPFDEVEENKDLRALGSLRNKIYRSDEAELDFDEIAKQVREIKSRYENLPICEDMR